MNRTLAITLTATSALLVAGCCWGPNAKNSGSATSGATPAAAEGEASVWPPMPTPGPAPTFNVPESESFTLANGIKVTLVTTGAVPLVELQLNIRSGSASDPAGKEGLAAVTADMLNEGVEGKDSLAIASELQRLASDVSLGASLDGSVVRVNSLEGNLEPTLGLVLEMLSSPTFADDDLKRVIEDRKRSLLSSKDDLPTIAWRSFRRTLFGAQYMGRPGAGTANSLDAISRDDVAGWHRDAWSPVNSSLVVVSRMDAATLKPLLDASFGAWGASENSTTPELSVAATESKTGVNVYWMDKPGASQSYIIVGNVAPAFDAATADQRTLGNHPVGGNFTARINMNLREDKGYTYGARSGFTASKNGGLFAASSSVRADVTAASITEILAEIRGALGDKPVSEDEHGRSVGSLVQAEPGSYERMSSVLGQFARADQMDYPEGHLQGRSARIAGISREDAQASFAEVVSGDDLVIMVVGDWSEAGPAVEELGLGAIIAVDDEGNPL